MSAAARADGGRADTVKLGGGVVGSFAILVFSAGLLLGMVLFGGLIWSDFESILFDPAWREDTPLRSLRCPVIVTPGETGVVSARVSNSLDRPTERYIRVLISDGSIALTREYTEVVKLGPGESRRVAWTVTADDAVYDRIIMVNAVLRRRYPLPARQSSCGILVVDVPYLTGQQFFGLALAASVLAMAGGYGLWVKGPLSHSKRGRQAGRAMLGLAGSVLAGIIIGLLGWWLPGLIVFVSVILGIGAIIGYFVNRN